MATPQPPPAPTVDAYIAAQSETVRPMLEQLRQLIRKAAPEADELISYAMPAFRCQGKLVWYAPNKNHLGLYIVPKVLAVFADQLSGYQCTKSAIHLPYNSPLPEALITDMITYAVQQNIVLELARKAAKKRA